MAVYFDHNASSPLRHEALESMLPFLTDEYGNASSAHAWGTRARCAVEEARADVAALVGCRPAEIVFTSGGTESNNTVILGARGRIVTTPIEHSSVLAPLAQHAAENVEYVHVDTRGQLDIDDLQRRLQRPAALVSIGWANSELGTLQPINEIASLCRAAGVPLHVDAVQAAGKIPIELKHVDLASLSAHKLGGPKGVGGLYVRTGLAWPALLHGGGQERERRSGTENVAGIVGFGTACRMRHDQLEEFSMHVASLRDVLWRLLQDTIEGVHRDGAVGDACLPNTLHVRIDGIRGEVLVAALDLRGIAVSSGSACAAGSAEPSHVLRALGLDERAARDGVRFSLGAQNTHAEVLRVAQATAEVVTGIRAVRAVA